MVLRGEGDCADTIESEESPSSDREESGDGEAMCDIEVFSQSSESAGNEKSTINDVDGEMPNILSQKIEQHQQVGLERGH